MASAPIDPDPPIAVAVLERGCELVPVPAAHLVRAGDSFAFQAANRAYRLSGLGTDAARSPMLAALGPRIDQFLRSDLIDTAFDWTAGEAIDCRYYRVTLARLGPRSRDHCAITFLDQTAQVQTERTLRREMTTDSLTGLPNRVGFGDLIEVALEQPARAAVLVIDLHRFGRLNACLGGLVGDELLITVARRIKGVLRACDTLARIGGDEFGILIAIEEGEAEAHRAAQRIERALAAPFRLTDYEISVECSIGIAFVEQVDDAEELIRHAQFGAKGAKSTGQATVYQNRAFAAEREQFGLETALRRAIEQEQLSLAYQPICDLATGRVVAFEALARWRGPDGLPIEPNRFIPVAEESGLIVPLGRWAIAEATRTLAQWDRRAGGDCGIQIAVNVSPIQLHRDRLSDVVEQALAKNGLGGARLKLELTESALIDDPDRTAGVMRALKGLGTSLAMDDFGTGYSNLAHLQRLPIDVLKIDRSFVTDMLADRDKVAIVRAILSLAQTLGMKTVAEGIEAEDVANTLAAMGCAYGQGFLYSPALDAVDAFALICSA